MSLRTVRVLWLSVAALAACTASHDPAFSPCTPETADLDCDPDEVCRATLEGERDGPTVCMRSCGDGDESLCPDGFACVNRRPGPPWVCWIGGPVPRGGPCARQIDCARGLACNRDAVCESLCDDHGDCPAELRCEYRTCSTPVPPGSACTSRGDCSPGTSRCTAQTLFTCQATCDPSTGECPDGSPCGWEPDCPFEPGEPIDTCERTPEGSVGCGDGEVCAMTSVGVRRCMRAGCRPDGAGDPCSTACLPDPEDPGTNICWLGGPLDYDAPCTSSYDCPRSTGCNTEGLCKYACTTEGAPCPTLDGHVCRDFVCTPEGP